MSKITVIPAEGAPREICGKVHGGKPFELTEVQAKAPLEMGLVFRPKTKCVTSARPDRSKASAIVPATLPVSESGSDKSES